MKSGVLLAMALQIVTLNAFAAEKISEPKISQVIQVDAAGKIAGVKSLLSFKAYSGGCTDKNGFSLQVEVTKTQQLLTVVRTVPDNCEAVGHLIDVEIPTDKLELSDVSGKPVTIVNPIFINFSFEQN